MAVDAAVAAVLAVWDVCAGAVSVGGSCWRVVVLHPTVSVGMACLRIYDPRLNA